jgi:hypothetical protein
MMPRMNKPLVSLDALVSRVASAMATGLGGGVVVGRTSRWGDESDARVARDARLASLAIREIREICG